MRIHNEFMKARAIIFPRADLVPLPRIILYGANPITKLRGNKKILIKSTLLNQLSIKIYSESQQTFPIPNSFP